MSIKEDIAMVKEELTSEEKFFEKSVMTERFVKKYKNLIIGGVVVIIIGIAGNIVYESNIESKVQGANKALATLMQDPKNEKVLLELKTLSPNLYDAFMYSRAIADKDMTMLKELTSSSSEIVSDLANYETSLDSSSLDAYALKQDSVYKDLAQVQSAILLLNEGKNDKAHEKLLVISENSSLSKIAQALLHYGVK